MMTQTAPDGEPHFVITMAEHTEMCGQLARAFGNDRFERLDPFEELVHVVENHDRGWDGYVLYWPSCLPAAGGSRDMARIQSGVRAWGRVGAVKNGSGETKVHRHAIGCARRKSLSGQR